MLGCASVVVKVVSNHNSNLNKFTLREGLNDEKYKYPYTNMYLYIMMYFSQEN